MKMIKTIVTLSGKDTIGIIAKVCTYFAENDINILDISQTTSGDRIDMMMVVDISNFSKQFSDMADELSAVGEGRGVVVHCQSEEIFEKMHRI